MKKVNQIMENYLETYAEQQAWLQLAVNTFKDFGDCPMVYYALFKFEMLE